MAAQEENYSLPAGFGTRPWLIQATRGKTLTLVDPSDQSSHETIIPEIEGKTCLGCLHDGSGDCWLVMLDERMCECFLLSLAARSKILLPPLREPLEFLAMCTAIESPGHPDFTVLISSTAEAGDRFLLHSRPGDQEWTKLTSPFGANGITFSSNMISYKGKVYSFTSSRALVNVVMILIDLDDGVVRVRQVGTIEYEDELAGSGYYFYLVESHGDLFAVWIQELGMFGNDGVLTDIVVYRLDRSAGPKSMVWRTVEGIGDDRESWSKVSNSIEQAKVWPWLMHCSKRDGTCKMFDPLRGKEYTLRVETFETDDERHIFRSSKDGWVVVSGGFKDERIFIINPFTGDLVEDPPMLTGCYSYNGISFSSNLASPDCLFFGINSSHSGEFVGVHTWKHGEDHWSEQEFEYQVAFPVAHNNPVLCCGKFYCLGRKGNLGVFDLGSKDPRSAWKILDKPEPIHAEMDLFDHDHEGREFCYLVELKGELVSVFMRNDAEPPRVFKLDKTKMAWIEVEDIGGAALFLDIRVSQART
ncbi:unnamed protein product [Urochloa humidicola]